MQLVFDIETDGLNPTVIWCIVAIDDKGKLYNYPEDKIDEGIELLKNADKIIGHNIIGFDIPIIKKMYPWFNPQGEIVDTLVLSRLYHPNMIEIDKRRNWKHMPLQLYGRHSLESYGYRLGEYKGNFGKDTDWSTWSQEMEDYCVQDVAVTQKLCNHFHRYLSGSNLNTK